jgi:hypothetical protein
MFRENVRRHVPKRDAGVLPQLQNSQAGLSKQSPFLKKRGSSHFFNSDVTTVTCWHCLVALSWITVGWDRDASDC